LFYIEQLFNGITQGSIYALMAIGYSLIFGTLGLVTFVYGEVVVFGVFVGYYLYAVMGLNFGLALALGLVVTWGVGIIVDKVCYEKFRNAPRLIMLITTIGFAIFLKSSTQIVFGTQQRNMPDILGHVFLNIGTFRIPFIQILIILACIFFIFGLQLLLYRTRIGTALRALSMDKDAAFLVGVDVDKVIKFGHSLGCVLGVFGGVLLGVFYNAINPIMGPNIGLKAFTATVLGGITSIPGAVIGGLILGVMENLTVAVYSAGYRDIIAFIILITVLVIRPSGLFGRKLES